MHPSEMTNDQLRLAIAEKLGYVKESAPHSLYWIKPAATSHGWKESNDGT